MKVTPRTGHWWPRKWTLGSVMITIAVLCGILTLARPLATPATIRAAEEVMRRYGPPGIDRENYRAEIVRMTPSGQWQVDFVRVSGPGALQQSAYVSTDLVRKVRFNPWYSLPLLKTPTQLLGPTPLDPSIHGEPPPKGPTSRQPGGFTPQPG